LLPRSCGTTIIVPTGSNRRSRRVARDSGSTTLIATSFTPPLPRVVCAADRRYPKVRVRNGLAAGAKRIRTLSPTRVRRLRQPQGSLLTPRWSKADSNSGSHPRATPPAATRFVADSALEGDGFEPSVPPRRNSLWARHLLSAHSSHPLGEALIRRGTKSSRCLTAPRLFI
jgi:hypothetical protein